MRGGRIVGRIAFEVDEMDDMDEMDEADFFSERVGICTTLAPNGRLKPVLRTRMQAEACAPNLNAG